MHSVPLSRNALLLPLLVVAFFAGTTATHAATSRNASRVATVEAPDPIKDATVNLYCRLKAGKQIFSTSGSGVVIDARGVILTNAHVAQYFLLSGEEGRVTGWCNVRTGSPAQKSYTAEVLYFPTTWLADNVSTIAQRTPRSSERNDFALLHITGAVKGTLPEHFPTLPLAMVDHSVDQSAVTVAGYPINARTFSQIRNKLTRIIASSTISNTSGFSNNQFADLLTVAPSAAGAEGASGGPVVDTSERLIGIITSKSSAKGDTTLRALTLSYIDRAIHTQTTVSLAQLLAGNLLERAAFTQQSILPDTISALMNGLRKKL